MPDRRFTPREIYSFQLAVARGAKAVEVARQHGFSPSNFRRWFLKYGRPYIPYEPTQEDRARIKTWREGKTLAEAWRLFRDLASSGPWPAEEAELPVCEVRDVDGASAEWQRLTLQTRADARLVLVCEKMHVEKLLDTWEGAGRPSAAHRTKSALARFPWLASSWVARTLRDHAKSLRAPLVFFGDLDPQALHAFAALRAGGHRRLLEEKRNVVPVTWLGLDSSWLAWLCRGLAIKDVPVSMRISLNWLDQEYWQVVKRLVPDARELIGARGYALLESGVKIEADAFRGRPFVEEAARRLRRISGPHPA